MKNKLIPLTLILFLTPRPIHPLGLKPQKAPQTEQVRTSKSPGVDVEGFQRYLFGIRYFPERKVSEIKKDMAEFYGYIDPAKTTHSPDPGLNGMFETFKKITEHVKKTMGSVDIDSKTKKINTKTMTGRFKESYEYMIKLITRELLGGDHTKLTTTAGEQYLDDFDVEAELVHYDVLNEILYLEKEIFAMLQAISYEAAQQSYLAKINAAFEELLTKYTKDFARIEKQLNNIITKVLGPQKGTHDFSLIWKAMLTAKYPVRKTLGYLYAAYYPDRELIYKEFINNREEVYKRLVYLAMEKLATVFTQLSPSTKVMENIIKGYLKEVDQYIKRPTKFLWMKFKKNKFDAWKDKTEKNLDSLAKRIKNLNCFKQWENYSKCEEAVNKFDEQIEFAQAEFDALYDEAEGKFDMAIMLQVAQKELVGDIQERMKKFPEKQVILRQEIEKLKTQFKSLADEQEKLKNKTKAKQAASQKELDDEEKELKKTLEARRKTEQDEKEATRGAWKRNTQEKEKVELEKQKQKIILPKEKKYTPSYLTKKQEKQPSIFDILKKKTPRKLSSAEKAGQEAQKELVDEIGLAAGEAQGARRRNIDKVKTAIQRYPPDKIDTIIPLLEKFDKKSDAEIEKLPTKLQLMGSLEKLKKQPKNRGVLNELEQLEKIVKDYPTEYIGDITPKFQRIGSKSNAQIGQLADELSKTSGQDEKELLLDKIKQVKEAPAKRPLTSYLDEIEELVRKCPQNKLNVVKGEVRGIENKTDQEIKYLPQQLKSLLMIEKVRRDPKRKDISQELNKLEEMVRAYPTKEAYEYTPKLTDLEKKSNKQIRELTQEITKDFQEQQKETEGELQETRGQEENERKAITKQEDELATLQKDEQELRKLKEQAIKNRELAIEQKNQKQIEAYNVQIEIIIKQQQDLSGEIQKLIDRNKRSSKNLAKIREEFEKTKEIANEMAEMAKRAGWIK